MNIELNLENLHIDQLGYVYKDVRKQASIIEKTYHLQKFALLEDIKHAIKYRGKDTEISLTISFGRLLSTQIELIQWNSGDCIYKEFIQEGKEGLHHLGIYVDNLEDYVNSLKRQGFEEIHSGRIGKQ
jgi:hypothetical protein